MNYWFSSFTDSRKSDVIIRGPPNHTNVTNTVACCSYSRRAEKSDSTPVPLPPSMVKVLAANLDWDEVEWSDSGVSVKDHHYPILTVQFKRITAQ